jgi:murein DD-endopeptidase MepM/ murein hydrolase activator NlpD
MLRTSAWAIALALVVGGVGTAAADHRNTDAGVGTSALSPDQLEALDTWPIPKDDGVPLDQTYPALVGWVHPVADSTELAPTRPQRKFNAKRDGAGKRPGCKRGSHCGLDLAGPRGRTIVAVTDGTVVHIENRRNGKDGQSGRYVRLEHADGVFTAYMHLDSIAPGLEVGQVVTKGTYIGRLGKTGIRHGEPHLHFNLELPYSKKSTKYIDATPFLQRSRVIPDPAPRRHDNSAKS